MSMRPRFGGETCWPLLMIPSGVDTADNLIPTMPFGNAFSSPSRPCWPVACEERGWRLSLKIESWN